MMSKIAQLKVNEIDVPETNSSKSLSNIPQLGNGRETNIWFARTEHPDR